MSISDNLNNIRKTLPEHVTLVAVSKTKTVEDIMQAYNAGQRVFGENKIQEMTSKWEELPKDIEWHMIGHVQRNKVKYMAGYVSLVHGVDNLKLLNEIDKQAAKHYRVIECLLQVHIASEETKFGFSENELIELVYSDVIKDLKHIRIAGLMGMATFTDDTHKIKHEFGNLKILFDKLIPLQTENFRMRVLSMGMSGDYKLAIDCGSNMVRIGSSIFGERNYNI